MSDLDELERLEKDATPGPWKCKAGEMYEGEDATGTYFAMGPLVDKPIDEDDEDFNDADREELNRDTAECDAKLINATRNALPTLIAELRAARACVLDAKIAERNRIADALDTEATKRGILRDVTSTYFARAWREFAERLRNGEV